MRYRNPNKSSKDDGCAENVWAKAETLTLTLRLPNPNPKTSKSLLSVGVHVTLPPPGLRKRDDM